MTPETQTIQGDGVSGVVSSVVEQIVVPPVSPDGAPVSGGVFKSITADSSGPAITPTLPAWWTYKVSDEVTLEGELSAQAFRIRSAPASDRATPESGERIMFNARLLVMNDADPSNNSVLLVLVGDRVNLDLIRLSELRVRVQGRLIPSQEAAKLNPDVIGEGEFPGFALKVTQYEKVRPAEVKAVYSGQVRIETLEGKAVAVLSDTITHRDYVLADSLEYTQSLDMYRQMIETKVTLSVIGLLVPDRTLAGRPVLRALQSNYGPGDTAQTIQGLRDQIENPIQDYGDEAEGPQDAIIDRVELVYAFEPPSPGAPAGYQPQPTELFYRLSGHSSDGQYFMTYDLTATGPTLPEARAIEPPIVQPLMPAPTEPTSESATPTLTSTPSPPTPASTATDGPPSTPEPTVLEVIRPITDRQIAIQLAIEIDRTTAQRDQSITEAMLAANPDMVTVECFANQAESGFGVATAYAEEPAWVVTFKGRGMFSLIGQAFVDQLRVTLSPTNFWKKQARC